MSLTPQMPSTNVYCVFYDPFTGEVVQTGSMDPAYVEMMTPEGASVVTSTEELGIAIDSHYVAVGVVRERLPVPLVASKTTIQADGVDEAVITGIPQGAGVLVDGSGYLFEGDPLVLTATVPTKYLIEVRSFPYLPTEIEIEAV